MVTYLKLLHLFLPFSTAVYLFAKNNVFTQVINIVITYVSKFYMLVYRNFIQKLVWVNLINVTAGIGLVHENNNF